MIMIMKRLFVSTLCLILLQSLESFATSITTQLDWEYYNETINCNETSNCDVNCVTEGACYDATINCPSNQDCTIVCNDYYSCEYAKINCPTDGLSSCKLICESEGINYYPCYNTTFNSSFVNNPILICTGYTSCQYLYLFYTNPPSNGTLKVFANDSYTASYNGYNLYLASLVIIILTKIIISYIYN